MLALCAGIFVIKAAVFHTAYASEILSSTPPETLDELQASSDAQLDFWAENLNSFDGRKFGYVTPTKNQYSHNICWAFAAVGAAEASILREGINKDANKNNLDLDEYVAAYATSNRDGSEDALLLTSNDSFSGNWDKGGFAHEAFNAISQGYALVDQTDDYYPTEETIKSRIAQSDYYLQNYEKVSNSRDAIKRAILKYGAVTMEYKSPGGMYAYAYVADNKATNHASIIVGWDDNVSRSNFVPNRPASDGAWIIKNSWGNYGNSYGGVYCYYLSYDTYFNNNIFAVDLAMKEDYQNLYHYDGQLAGGIRNYAADAQAAIYEAKLSSATEQEQLRAVTVFTGQSELTANVKVYRHLNVNPGNVNDEMNIPTQGEPVLSQDVELAALGMHTIDLKTPVELEQGEYFSIVVSCMSAYKTHVPLLCAMDGGASVNDMTYYLYNDLWRSYKASYNYADTSYDNMAARIRAVTNTVQRETPLENDLKYARVEIKNRLVFYEKDAELVPDVTVYFGEKLLREGSDYEKQISDNIAPGMATIKITGTGNYYGSRTTSFEIAKPKYPPNRLEGTVVVYRNVTRLHQISIPDEWEWIDGDRDLEFGRSYFPVSIKYVGDDKDFYILNTCDFYVERLDEDPPDRIDIALAQIEISGEYRYSGKAITPSVKATYDGRVLHLGVDYLLSCLENVNAGMATVKITGVGQYKGEISREFEIKRAEKPFKLPNGVIYVSRKAKTLRDVSIGVKDWTWQDPSQEIGEFAIAVYEGEDKDNFEDLTAQISIVRREKTDVSSLDARLEKDSFVFTGEEIKPNVMIKDGNFELEADVDFTVEYQNNLNAGGATAVVRGIGDYDGEETLNFEIKRADRTQFSVTIENWIYGERSSTPNIMGYIENAAVTYEFSNSQDGKYALETPQNAGEYRLRAQIEQSENYNAATAYCSFEILKKDLSEFAVTINDGQEYTGEPICPEAVMKDGEKTLIYGEDFSISYENNVNVGLAKAIIEGKNNYEGKIVENFEIKKASGANINTTISLNGAFENLSEVPLPDGFCWDEATLEKISEERYRAIATYIGENYAIDRLEFEIVISSVEKNPAEHERGMIWLFVVIPISAIALAGIIVGIAFAIKRSKVL